MVYGALIEGFRLDFHKHIKSTSIERGWGKRFRARDKDFCF